MTKHKITKSIVSYVLAFVMICGMLPMSVFAAEGDTFENGGLTYTVLSEDGNTGTVSLTSGNDASGEITIPETVTSGSVTYTVTAISFRAFYGCTSLIGINIPSSVKNIEHGAFEGCTNLANVNISDGVQEIWNGAFYGCTALTSITIPESVTLIGSAAFQGCTGLTSITIPDSVTTIHNNTFTGCTNLTDIYYDGTANEWAAISIGEGAIPDGVTIHTTPDLIITGGTEGTDYTYENGVLDIKAAGRYEIRNADPTTATSDIIKVSAPSGTVNITLNGVVINVSATNLAAFEITGECTTKLILKDGSENSLDSGVNRAGIANHSHNLIITCENAENATHICSSDCGVLRAIGQHEGAGIGGDRRESGSNITITGGNIVADIVNSGGGAGIGGGYNGTGDSITISGGAVTATSVQGAGIGGGEVIIGTRITISGGTVTATSVHGAGIGGGRFGGGDSITISGGTVTATSEQGAGIGGGADGGIAENIKIAPAANTRIYAYNGSDNTGTALTGSPFATETDITSLLSGHAFYAHSHNFSYASSGDSITETCACGHSETATIVAPTDLIFDGNAKEATVIYSAGWQGGELTVTYSGNNTGAGNITASITMGGATASLDFTIELCEDTDGDGIYEDGIGNLYVPDQNGDGVPEKVTDTDGDGVYEDENGTLYIPDQNGDGVPEKLTDADGDGIYEDANGKKYITAATVEKLQADLEKAKIELEEAIAAQIDPTELADAIKNVTDIIDALDGTYATDAKVAEDIAAAKQAVTDAYTEALDKAVADLEAKIAAQIDPTELADAIKNVTDIIDALDGTYATDTAVADAIAKAKEDVTTAYEKAIADAVAKLEAADKDHSDALAKAIADLEMLIDAAEQVAIAGDNTLIGKITEAITKAEDELKAAKSELEALIGGVQSNFDSAKADLEQAIADLEAAMDQGDADLSAELASLNTALADAKATLEKVDADNKAELEGKITEAQTALQSAIDKVASDLATAEKELADAIASGDAALSERISALSTSLDNAISAYQAADGSLKTELTTKIDEADATLDAAIKAVQKNLDDAKAELNKAITDGDTALDGKITALNEALATAKAALEAADSANKSELTTKIDEAYASLDAAVKAVQKNLDDVKAALEAKDAELDAKDSELQTFIIIVCIISGVALCGSGAFVVWFFIDRKKRI